MNWTRLYYSIVITEYLSSTLDIRRLIITSKHMRYILQFFFFLLLYYSIWIVREMLFHVRLRSPSVDYIFYIIMGVEQMPRLMCRLDHKCYIEIEKKEKQLIQGYSTMFFLCNMNYLAIRSFLYLHQWFVSFICQIRIVIHRFNNHMKWVIHHFLIFLIVSSRSKRYCR
jgi:hypothetical protein